MKDGVKRIPMPLKEGAKDAKHPSKGTIGFPSEKNWRETTFLFYKKA